jgi:hypothetical protein
VERLRGHIDSMCMNNIVCGDAADEIERLRRWKAEATEVLNHWENLADDVLNHRDCLANGGGCRLGQRRSDAVAAEIERLRAALALADQMVDAMQWAFDPSLGEETHDTIFAAWQDAQKTLSAYEEARRER